MHWTPFLSDPDSFYHIKISQVIADQGIIKNFPNLQFTILKDNFVDHHLLYHLYLAPFVKYISPFWGAKIGHLILDCLVFLAVFIFLKKFKVKLALPLTLTMFLSSAFVFRMLLIKAQPISLILIIICTYLIIKRKHLLLAIASFIYVWAYSGWFLVIILALAYIFIKVIDEVIKIETPRLNRNLIKNFFKSCFTFDNFKIIIYPLIGITLGLIINPYFPKNLYFSFVHIVQIGLINKKSLGIGAEWFPFTPTLLFASIVASIIILCFPFIFQAVYFKKIDLKSKFLMLLTILFLLVTLKSKRNIEYFVPFAVLTAGLTFQSAFADEKIKNDWKIFTSGLKKLVSLRLVSWVAIIVFTLSGVLVVLKLQTQSQTIPLNRLEKSSQWLMVNSSQGKTIFNLRWDRFPMLYFYNSKNFYVAGLDPTFTYVYNKDLFQKYYDISKGKLDENSASIIKKEFNAKLLIATKEDKKILQAVEKYPSFEKVYEDDEAIIYKINE
ncbi:MAG: hypothetical protein WCV92_00095 [Candidatus Buchananbacteria bacterium]